MSLTLALKLLPLFEGDFMGHGVRHFLAPIAFILAILFSSWTQAAQSKSKACAGLVDEMQMMRRAQSQILTSLAQNHELFANQLSDLSFELALYKKTVPQKALISMEKSSQAYRGRGVKALETAEKLDDMTADLIARLQGCLK